MRYLIRKPTQNLIKLYYNLYKKKKKRGLERSYSIRIYIDIYLNLVDLNAYIYTILAYQYFISLLFLLFLIYIV